MSSSSKRRSAAAVALAIASFAATPDAGARTWQVAAPAACAEVPARAACQGVTCNGALAPVRGRFDPVDVASGGAPGQTNPLPDTPRFPGPGACVEAGSSCGNTVPTPSSARSPSLVEQPSVPVKPPGIP